MEQFRLAREEKTCLALARQFVHGKIRNHRTLLMRNHLEPPEGIIGKLKRASEDALTANSIEELLGIEGAAASQYFQQFNGMVKVEDDLPGLGLSVENTKQRMFNFNFNHRNRRPPTDPALSTRCFRWLIVCWRKIARWPCGSQLVLILIWDFTINHASRTARVAVWI